MIKWVWFWKLLKQFCFILLISCFIWLGSFSNASFIESWYYYYWDIDDINSYWWNNYIILSNWNLNTFDSDFDTSVFYWPYSDWWLYNNYNFGWINWNLYFSQYLSRSSWISSIQWFIDKWCIVPVSTRQTWGSFLHSNCSYNKSFNEVKSSFWGFSSYAFEVVWVQKPFWFLVFSNFQFCFTDSIYDYCFQCGVSGCPSWLTWDLQIDLSSFQKISNYSWGYSPFDWHINWWSSEAVIWILSGNQNYVKCTLNTALHWYKYKWYSDRLCYWWLDNYSILWTDDFIPIYWQWIYLTDLYNNTKTLRAKGHTWTEMSKSEWFSYWRNLYIWYKNWMYSINPFSDNPAVLFTYFGAVDVYWGAFNNESILEYCKISSYNWDLSALYSWVNYDSVCNWSPISVLQDSIEWELSSSWYNEWANWDVSIGASWDWVLSWWITFTNWKTFISDTFNRLKDNFLLPVWNGWVFWVLPGYIILAMLWLILFRFLSH